MSERSALQLAGDMGDVVRSTMPQFADVDDASLQRLLTLAIAESYREAASVCRTLRIRHEVRFGEPRLHVATPPEIATRLEAEAADAEAAATAPRG